MTLTLGLIIGFIGGFLWALGLVLGMVLEDRFDMLSIVNKHRKGE